MSLSILVLEPDTEIRWLLADLLQRRGYEVFTFADDHDMLAYLRANPPKRHVVLDSRAASSGRSLQQHLRERCWLYPLSLVTSGRPFRINDLCGQLERARRELGASTSGSTLQAHDADSEPT